MKIKHFCFLFFWLSSIVFAACGSDKGEHEIETEPTPEPPTTEDVVLNKATVILGEEQLDYVTSVVTGNDIYFSSYTDKAKLPTVGQVLLVTKLSDKFPYGFMGRVKRIADANGSYKVETESVALDEVFDELHIDQSLRLMPDEEKARALGWDYSIDDEGFLCFNRSLQLKVDELETSGTATFSIKPNFIIDINNKAKKKYVSLTLIARFSSDLNISANLVSEERVFEWFKQNIPLKVAPATALGGAITIFLRPSLDVIGYVKANGAFSVNAGGHWFKEVVAGAMYTDEVGWKGNYRPQENGKNGFELKGVKAELDGTLREGISIGMSVRLMNDDIAHADVTARAEMVQEAKISFDVLEQYGYDVLKDTYLGTRIEISGGIEGELPIIKDFPKIGRELFPTLKLHEQNFYLFPLFDDLSVTTDRGKLTATVKSGVHRDLLFPNTKVGILLSDKDMNSLQESHKMIYQKEEEFPSSWENGFSGLQTNVDYHVQPFVQFSFLNKLFRTSSVKKFRIEKPEVLTLEVVEIGENSAVCKGQYKLGEEERPSSYGICFSATNATPTVSDTKVTSSNADAAGSFSVKLTGLSTQKDYYYRAFIIKDDKTYYGEVKLLNISFPIGTWRNTYVEWRERVVGDEEFQVAGEKCDNVIVFMANGHIGSLGTNGEVIETTSTYAYDPSTNRMRMEGYDDVADDNPQWVVYTLDIERTSDGFKLINHSINGGVETYTTNTFVKMENGSAARVKSNTIRFK